MFRKWLVNEMNQREFDKWLSSWQGDATKLEATPENLAKVKEFLLLKWRERATERGRDEPSDLSGACKFGSLFAKAIFGGKVRGNTLHQVVYLADKVIDLTDQSLATFHDRKFFGNKEHRESLMSCIPRVEGWVKEFWLWYQKGNNV